MWDLWFLNTNGDWEYVDSFSDYLLLVHGCNEIKEYARVILQTSTETSSTALTTGWGGTARTATTLSLISPNKVMT